MTQYVFKISFGKMKFQALYVLLYTVFSLNGCGSSQNRAIHSIPDEKKKILLIENFKNNSVDGSKYDPWSYGLSSMIQEDLILSGYFKLVSEDSRYKSLQEQTLGLTGLIDDTKAVKMGKLLGANWILAGDFIVMVDSINISARFIEVETGRVIAVSQKRDKLNLFFEVVKSASVSLMQQVKLELSDTDVRIITSAIETKNIDASLFNYHGEFSLKKIEALKNSKDKVSESDILKLENAARDDFRKALDLDPKYEKAKSNLGKLSLMLPSSL